ncbi:zinc ribbon domain-containing protein [Candidatus Methylacidiphilum fumarolicum]|uniref:zinc ribbon domain-containing protein n=1 Tax=Candidatus Methylacidiphilum fumarolicum TaxID=591154 RepID=UPI000AD4A5AD
MRDINHPIRQRVVDSLKSSSSSSSRLEAHSQLSQDQQKQALRAALLEFGHLFLFCRFKAAERAVSVVQTDQRNTRRKCLWCRCVEKDNRNGHLFCFVFCGYCQNTDSNAVFNFSMATRTVAIGCSLCSLKALHPTLPWRQGQARGF